MAGIQHRDPGGEINIVVSSPRRCGILRRAGKEITLRLRRAEWQKVCADEISVTHVRYPFVETIIRQDDRAGCSTPRPSP